VALTKIETDEVKAICAEYKIHNCDIIFREDCTADQLIDVIEGNRCAHIAFLEWGDGGSRPRLAHAPPLGHGERERERERSCARDGSWGRR
jgi:hypothetical protein